MERSLGEVTGEEVHPYLSPEGYIENSISLVEGLFGLNNYYSSILLPISYYLELDTWKIFNDEVVRI